MSDSINLTDGLMASGKWSDVIKKKTAQEWIPTSERLPEERGRYLISHEEGHVFTDTWLGDDGWNIYAKVLAWMPLPEPYKGGDVE